MICRGVVDLSGLVPIYDENGCRRMSEARPYGLYAREAGGFPAGGKDARAGGPSPFLAARTVLVKIDDQLACRCGGGANDVESIMVTAHPPAEGAARVLGILEEAVGTCRTLELEYFTFGRNGAPRRDVDPYGRAFRRHCWYMVGRCHLRGGERFFRLDRILSVNPTRREFERPPDFSVEGFFAETREVCVSAAKKRVKSRFASRLESVVKPELDRGGKFRAGRGREGLAFEGGVPLSDEFFPVTFGEGVEVLEPTSLRGETAEGLGAAAYGDSEGGP